MENKADNWAKNYKYVAKWQWISVKQKENAKIAKSLDLTGFVIPKQFSEKLAL